MLEAIEVTKRIFFFDKEQLETIFPIYCGK